MTPFFQTRERVFPPHGQKRDWPVLPAFWFAIYDGTELSGVYPHADDRETATVEDGIQALERDDGSILGQQTLTAD